MHPAQMNSLMIRAITLTNAPTGPLARQWLSLYCQLSTNPLPAEITGIDPLFGELLRTLYASQGQEVPGMSADLWQPLAFRSALRGHVSTCLVAFTGGKDSTATALELRRQGIEPTLFYVKGLNSQSYAGEQQYAARVAGVLDMPLVQIDVKQAGTAEYPDNPVKNQTILALMVEHGQRHGFFQFAQGNLRRERIAETNIRYTASDAAEMYEAAAQVFDHFTRGTFRYLGGLMEYESESYQVIADQCPAALDVLMSCVQAYRHRTRVRMANEQRYGVTLRPENCGTCYKCASEYLHRCLLGLTDPVPTYVARCTHILQEAYQRLANLEHRPAPAGALDWFIEPSIFDSHALRNRL